MVAAALGALVFAVASGHRLSTIWQGTPEHIEHAPTWVSSPSSPLHGFFKTLAANCIGWSGAFLVGVGAVLRPAESSAAHPGYIMMVIGAAMIVTGAVTAVTILAWSRPRALVPHPYRPDP